MSSRVVYILFVRFLCTALFLLFTKFSYCNEIPIDIQNPTPPTDAEFKALPSGGWISMGVFKTKAEAESAAYSKWNSLAANKRYAFQNGSNSAVYGRLNSTLGFQTDTSATVRHAYFFWYYPNELWNTPSTQLFYFAYDGPDVVYQKPDADNDGIPDQFDLYPNDPEPYKFQVLTYYVDEFGHKVPITIMTDKFTQGNINPITGQPLGDCFTVRECPDNENEELSVSNIWISSTDLEDTLTQSFTDEDIAGMTFPPNNSPINGGSNSVPNSPPTGSTDGSTPEGTVTDGKKSSDTDTDSQLTGKIVDNTSDIVTNQGIQNGLLKGINKELQDLNKRQILSGSTNTGGGITKAELKDVIEDNENSPEYVNNTDGKLIDHDYGTAFETVKTKYSDRLNGFVETISNSDLFSFHTSFFNGLPSGGSSTISVDIGKWGYASQQSESFDFSQWSKFFDVLKAVIMILTGYKSIKIVMLKSA